ncbi:MAG: SNF2-related protein [Gaiellaceae bacterium]
MSAARTVRTEAELAQVAGVVGAASFGRGRSYARGGRVLRVAWDAGSQALTGSVVGNGALYETTAQFVNGLDDGLAFDHGRCSCPVGYDCKHVAALVIAAADGHAAGGPLRIVRIPAEASWERPLRALFDQPEAETGGPLGLELSLRAAGFGGSVQRLLARPLRPGARGGWVKGSLSWNNLTGWDARGTYRNDHVALLDELHALQRAQQRLTSYSWYGYADKTLDLSDCGSHLWSLIDEAARIGLVLLDAGAGPGELPPYQRGELAFDVTRPGEAQVRAVLRPDGEGDAGALQPALFLGTGGHGLVCTGSDGRLRLVRLAREAPLPLQRLVLDGTTLDVPAAELDRFAAEICPALSRVASLVSSDGSFEPPEVSAPELVLRIRHGVDNTVELGWEWLYRVAEDVHRAPLSASSRGAGFRDLAAEREIVAASAFAGTGLERYGLVDGSGRPAGGAVLRLIGIESMRFTTEHLPGLLDSAGCPIELQGQAPDYRDVGESLEIGLSTAEIDGERDWFDLGVTISVEGRRLPFAEVFVALASGQSHMLLADGAHFSLDDPRLRSLQALIEEARALQDSPSETLRINRYQADLWSELVALGLVTEQAQRWQRQVEALLELDSLSAHAPPASLTAELRPYQRDGFRWLAAIRELELGGILADEMGLGKTLQTLALVCHAREQDDGNGPFLVVAPTSVVQGWVAEAARFAPGLRVEAATGTFAKSGRSIADLATADLAVTTYTLLRLDADAYQSVEWAGVILDEAQQVKNHQAKTYRCVRELRAGIKLALTGTPMENNLMELWSLLSITAPGLFPDPKRFAADYARPIERGDAERLLRLRRRIKPLVKRRTKELVAADLPPKQDQTLHVDLHGRHRKLYDTHLQRERQKILGLLDDFDRNRFVILRSITLLRQLSLHAALVDPNAGAIPSAKIEALVEQLADVTAGGHRALVFSQFTGFLGHARASLEKAGIGYCYLDGRTRRRERVVERFRQGADPVFLISLKAGGFGLNLTEADYCFLLDPWWNPATENQAIDRTHRIGQTRPVNVYRLIARETIEEKVAALAQRKARLFRGVLDDGDLFAGEITADDIRGLLS